MRVGLVSPYAWDVPGGVNDHIASLARELAALGHEPWVIAPNGSILGFRRRRAVPDRFISAGSALPFSSNGSKAYINVWPLMPRRMSRILQEGGFDIVHVHEPCVPSVAGSTLLVGAVPMVGTFHAAGTGSPLYKALAPAARYAIGRLAVKIAVSGAARDFVAGAFPGEYRVIPNGVRISDYAPAREIPKKPGRILFVGRAEPRKGLFVLLRAFEQIRRSRPDVSLALVGPGWAEARGARSGVDRRAGWPLAGVVALGRAGHEVKVHEMGQAEVLCVPSLRGESFGLVLAEGLAAGVPVVASDLPGYNSVLDGGALGQLVPPGDADALAGEIVRLLDDPARRARVVARGIRAVERYSWGTVVGEVLQAYEDALAAAPVGCRSRLVRSPRRRPLLVRTRSR